SVARWVEPDPGALDPSASLEERRQALRAIGQQLLPTNPRANGYVEAVAAADVDVRAAYRVVSSGAAGALGASAAIDASGEGHEREPAIAADAEGRVFIAWGDDRGAVPQIWLAISADGGRTFGSPAAVAPSAGAQRSPAIATDEGVLMVAWVERSSGS